jgi:hypothetical protein
VKAVAEAMQRNERLKVKRLVLSDCGLGVSAISAIIKTFSRNLSEHFFFATESKSPKALPKRSASHTLSSLSAVKRRRLTLSYDRKEKEQETEEEEEEKERDKEQREEEEEETSVDTLPDDEFAQEHEKEIEFDWNEKSDHTTVVGEHIVHTIEELDLSLNDIRNAGAALVALFVNTRYCSLKKLNLAVNCIQKKGMIGLFDLHHILMD